MSVREGGIFSTRGRFARKNTFLAAKALGDSPLHDALDWFDLSRIHEFLVDLTKITMG